MMLRHVSIVTLAVFAIWPIYGMANPTADSILSRGKVVYEQTCIMCHGYDGAGGMPGVPDMTEAGGSLEKPDTVLKHNIINGLQNPGITIAMPARGGNPTLTNEQIDAVITYMRHQFETKSHE